MELVILGTRISNNDPVSRTNIPDEKVLLLW